MKPLQRCIIFIILRKSDHWASILEKCKKKGINCPYDDTSAVLTHKDYQVAELASLDRIHREAFEDFSFFSEEVDFALQSCFKKERNNTRKSKRKMH